MGDEVWNERGTLTRPIPDRLSERIMHLIDSDQFEAGTRLPSERTLSNTFGVSRGSVRNALQDLELRGYLLGKPRSGWVVSSPNDRRLNAGFFGRFGSDIRSVRHVMDLRALIEPPIAARAATRRRLPELQDLEQPLLISERELVAENPRTSVFQHCDVEFHATIASLAHNPLLSSLVDEVRDLTSSSRHDVFQNVQRTRSSVAAHRLIFAAIELGDAEAAQRAMTDHIDEVTHSVNVIVTSRADEPSS